MEDNTREKATYTHFKSAKAVCDVLLGINGHCPQRSEAFIGNYDFTFLYQSWIISFVFD